MIHATAIVDPTAALAPDVAVGPFAMIEAGVRLGPGCVVHARAHLAAGAVLGAENVVHIGAVLGQPADDAPDGHPPGGFVAGDRNEFREYCSVKCGISAERPTRIGDENYVMGGARLGPGVRIGNHATVAPYVVVGQGVEIGDQAFISGTVIVQPRVRIGRLAFVSGVSAVQYDAPPFMTVGGRPATPLSLNSKGLERAGFSKETSAALKKAFKALFFRTPEPTEEAIRALESPAATPEERELAAFLRAIPDVRNGVEDQLIV